MFSISIGLNVALLVILIYDHYRISKLEKQNQAIEWRFPRHKAPRPPLIDDLRLSHEQDIDITKEMHLYRTHIKILADSMNIIRDSLFRELNNDQQNDTVINNYIDKLVYYDRKMHEELVKHLKAVKLILDDEQFKIFMENIKNKFKPRCKQTNKKYKSYEKVNEYFNYGHPYCGIAVFDGSEKKSTNTTFNIIEPSSRTTQKSLWLASHTQPN
ncbi:MAG: hypothetical protein WC245_06385 [Bacteroidales bacterium]|nr:hypothetical protein [Bacteroidales bacterium]MDY0401614.1 hypothetical protein [Bacteroidales bacterium]HOB78319.1 hypothetical protein [Bacteroidales bacterium]HPZ61739.1 hypothetical protein [Bacteroidales bacterium]HQD59462.1 hypothetical protein [Bacteroidales bacterium]